MLSKSFALFGPRIKNISNVLKVAKKYKKALKIKTVLLFDRGDPVESKYIVRNKF